MLEHISKSLHRPVLMCMPFMMLGMGVLMVSRVHYPHVGDRLLRGRKSFMHLLRPDHRAGGVLIVMHPDLMLALGFNGYMVFGLVQRSAPATLPRACARRVGMWRENAAA